MRRYWYLIAVLLVLGLLVIGIGLTRNHWWLKTNTPKVFFNGEEVPDSKVFTSVDGDYLLSVRRDNKSLGAYTILRNEEKVGLTSANEFVKLPWCYFVWTYPIPISPISSQAAYLTAEVKFENQSVTFTLPINENTPGYVNTIKVEF